MYSFNLDLLRHYYVTFESPLLQLEVHLGEMVGGTHKQIGTTNGQLIKEVYVCDSCFQQKLLEARYTQEFNLYPFINCESLARELVNEWPISWQAVYIVGSLFTLLLLAIDYFIILIFVAFITQHGSNLYKTKCKHL